MVENTADVLPDTPTPGTIEQIALQIKSLEQRITSVTLPRTASVLELKQEIQVAFDVESTRQRLIFQGRVLKDDKNLTDYANLDNGKVIHLVIRPIDAPHNPMNDDPNPGTNIRHSFGGRGGPNGRSRPFPSITSRLPMMEGYAFITLDSNLGDLGGDNQSILSSVLNGFSGGLRRTPSSVNLNTTTATNTNNNSTDNHATDGLGRTNTTTSTTSTGSHPGILPRSPFSFTFGRTNSSELASPLVSSPLADRVTSGLPFPPSVEVRLARTLGSMRNVRTMLEDTANNDESSNFSSTPNSTHEQLQEIRNTLRTSGNNQSAQIGMVLNELADLMTEAAPRMRDVSQSLRQENQTPEEERNTSRRVLNMSRIVQGMSLINHFLGSVLASADIDSRRSASNNTSSTSVSSATSTASNATQSSRTPVFPSYFSVRGNTEAIRTPAPNVDTRNVTPTTTDTSNSNNNNATATTATRSKSTTATKSSLSSTNKSTPPTSNTTGSSSSSSDSASRGVKRRIDQVGAEDIDAANKDPKNEKGKEKDKKV